MYYTERQKSQRNKPDNLTENHIPTDITVAPSQYKTECYNCGYDAKQYVECDSYCGGQFER